MCDPFELNIDRPWIIDNGENMVAKIQYIGMKDGCLAWISNSYESLWFCRFKDAKRFSKKNKKGWRIRQHNFVGRYRA